LGVDVARVVVLQALRWRACLGAGARRAGATGTAAGVAARAFGPFAGSRAAAGPAIAAAAAHPAAAGARATAARGGVARVRAVSAATASMCEDRQAQSAYDLRDDAVVHSLLQPRMGKVLKGHRSAYISAPGGAREGRLRRSFGLRCYCGLAARYA